MGKSLFPDLIGKGSFSRSRFIQGNLREKISYRNLQVPGIDGLLGQFLYLDLISQRKNLSLCSQYIQADGMKGSDLDLFQGSFISQLFLQTFSHLLGSFVSKSYRCDLRRLYLSPFYKRKDLFNKSLGLSCTRSCNNGSHRMDTLHCFLLLLVKFRKRFQRFFLLPGQRIL